MGVYIFLGVGVGGRVRTDIRKHGSVVNIETGSVEGHIAVNVRKLGKWDQWLT